tara:strand:- start:270 stop:446 length:177 start_codon:yes stop_codon:yes gene_type:complete
LLLILKSFFTTKSQIDFVVKVVKKDTPEILFPPFMLFHPSKFNSLSEFEGFYWFWRSF